MAKLIKAKVIGTRAVKYTSKKTGEVVEGKELHCTMNSDDVTGEAVGTVFVSKTADLYVIGDVISLFRDYNRNGYILVED